ncbi:MAG TPA: sulfurtransferase, partial [Opitutae bacterium]|nr:sulfurtransferase [Opitutae bacterium]
MKKIVSIISFFVLAATSYAGEYEDISIKDLQKAIADGKVAVIDVNGAKSFENGHIPTAIHFSSSKNKLSKLLPKDKNT